MFLQSGEFYWNSGIFVWKVRSIVEAFEKYLPEHHALFSGVMRAIGTDAERNVVEIAFSECRAISIDYGIMEKADNVYVRCGEFGWSDVGTWGSVYQHSRKDRYANAVPEEGCYLYDTRSSIVSLPKDKIAVISGLKEYIVVDTDDVLWSAPLRGAEHPKNSSTKSSSTTATSTSDSLDQMCLRNHSRPYDFHRRHCAFQRSHPRRSTVFASLLLLQIPSPEGTYRM